jgi:NAD+ synthase (glutamine-hydrolysing)
MFDIIRVAAASPDLQIADPFSNGRKLGEIYRSAAASNASLVLFPSFALTGRSCGKLFSQAYLLESARQAAEDFAAQTGEIPAVFGMPELVNGKLLECAVIAQNGRICAHTVRMTPDLPDFSGWLPDLPDYYPAGQVFTDGKVRFSVSFAGDRPEAAGAQIELFCGAEPEIPGAWAKRENIFTAVSAMDDCAVAAAFSGSGETTGDNLYGGSLLICDRGRCTAARRSPVRGGGVIYSDIDLEKISAAQLGKTAPDKKMVKLSALPEAPDFKYLCNPQHPFLPQDAAMLADFCRESFAIQTIGLGERLKRCGAKKMVIGISGGLDSTLALVVMAMVCREYDLPPETILAITMPGFGTTGRTKNNALRLAELIGAEIREIPIAQACLQHFSDIGHDPENTGSVYENSQARERTQILMDVANAVNGIVIGTGDLSEIALGWSTFNGDQMAMHAVNSAIPKSNIAAMLNYAADQFPGAAEILQDVIDTPVSPELLPLDENGEIVQKTEAILGAYELHDFYLWHLFAGTSAPEKLLALAIDAFGEKYQETELRRVRDLFIKRFFTQQFKRTAGPDGIQAGAVSLSCRTTWQMPSDVNGTLWYRK